MLWTSRRQLAPSLLKILVVTFPAHERLSEAHTGDGWREHGEPGHPPRNPERFHTGRAFIREAERCALFNAPTERLPACRQFAAFHFACGIEAPAMRPEAPPPPPSDAVISSTARDCSSGGSCRNSGPTSTLPTPSIVRVGIYCDTDQRTPLEVVPCPPPAGPPPAPGLPPLPMPSSSRL